MKVTKLIREYVREQVSKIYDAKVNPYTEQANKDREKIKAFEEELKEHQKKVIEQFISDNELYTKCWDGIKPMSVCTSIPSFYNVLTPSMLNEKQWGEKNKNDKEAKYREIMLALELGANRDELNRMIAELLKSEN